MIAYIRICCYSSYRNEQNRRFISI